VAVDRAAGHAVFFTTASWSRVEMKWSAASALGDVPQRQPCGGDVLRCFLRKPSAALPHLAQWPTGSHLWTRMSAAAAFLNIPCRVGKERGWPRFSTSPAGLEKTVTITALQQSNQSKRNVRPDYRGSSLPCVGDGSLEKPGLGSPDYCAVADGEGTCRRRPKKYTTSYVDSPTVDVNMLIGKP